jgi:Ca-activated chloride channel homolog
MEANVNLDRTVLALETGDVVHLMVELTAPPLTVERPRPPLDLVAVIDRSGSMNGAPIDSVKAAAGLLNRLLDTDDRLAVVSFDDEVRLDLPLRNHHPGTADRRLAQIEVGGCTNLSGGWLKGVEVLEGARPDATRKVVLLTDGLANRGLTDRDRLATLAQEAAGRGIGTTTIGYGDGFDEDLLALMADAGRGNTYWAAGPDEAATIFAAEFDGLASTVAQNLSVEIRPSAEVDVVGVLHAYPSVSVDGGVQVALGDAYADERRSLVAALSVPGLVDLGPTVIAELVIRYALIGEQVEMHTVTVPVMVNVAPADTAAAAPTDARVVEEVLTLRAAAARRQARQRANEGDVDGARRVLGQVSGELRQRAGDAADPTRILSEADEIDRTSDELIDASTRLLSAKAMWAAERTTSRGRASRPVQRRPRA